MVYHGPSKGCSPCRKRKVRCDQNKPQCHACLKRGISCPGPRVGKGETEFRAEYATAFGQQDPPESPKQPALRDADSEQPITSHATTQTSPDISHDNSWTQPVCFCEECWTAAEPSPDGLISRLPSGGQYGNASIGICRADPALISLLDFWRRMALHDVPSIDGTMVRPNLGKKAWALSLISLHDGCLGYAFLAVASCYYAKVSKSYDMNVFHLDARMRSVSNARKQLESMGLVEHMISNLCIILAAELVAEDWKACSQHAKFLVGVLQPKEGEPAAVSESTRHSLLHMDIERATAMGTVPFVDLETWAYDTDQLDDWSAIALHTSFSDVGLLSMPVDADALCCARLCSLFTRIRRYSHLLSHSVADSLSRATAFQFSNAIDIVAGNLLVYYAQRTESLARTPYSAMLEEDYLNCAQQAAAALAALYYLRLRGRQEWIGEGAENQRKFRNGGFDGVVTPSDEESFMMERFCAQAHRIYKRLERVLRASEKAFEAVLAQWQQQRVMDAGLSGHSIPFDDDAFPAIEASPPASAEDIYPAIRLRVWLLHVGSTIERTADFPDHSSSESPSASPTPFNTPLAQSSSSTKPRPTYCRNQLASLIQTLCLADSDNAAAMAHSATDLLRDIVSAFLPLTNFPPSHDDMATLSFHIPTPDSHSYMALSSSSLSWLVEPTLSATIYGPRWMSPVLRIWGLTNWDGEMG